MATFKRGDLVRLIGDTERRVLTVSRLGRNDFGEESGKQIEVAYFNALGTLETKWVGLDALTHTRV